MHFRQRVDDVKRGVLQAGGFPLEMPAISLNDAIVKSSALRYRNMMAMEVEEMIRCYPVDAVVLMRGCDKTGAQASWTNLNGTASSVASRAVPAPV